MQLANAGRLHVDYGFEPVHDDIELPPRLLAQLGGVRRMTLEVLLRPPQ
jgi:hypothetical protein